MGNFWNNNYIDYEGNGYRNKIISLDEYLDKIRPYLRDITIDLQESNTWKIQLTIAINYIKDTKEECVMCSKSSDLKFQGNLETSMRVSDFIFDSVQLLYYKCHRINFRRSGSYNDYPDWIKKKKAINP